MYTNTVRVVKARAEDKFDKKKESYLFSLVSPPSLELNHFMAQNKQ